MTIGPTAYFHELVDKIEALERLFVVPECSPSALVGQNGLIA